jgi:hypothetical protein
VGQALACEKSEQARIALFDDPILAQSAFDRLAHNAYQLVMEGESFRKRQRPELRDASAPPPPKPRSRRRRRNG